MLLGPWNSDEGDEQEQEVGQKDSVPSSLTERDHGGFSSVDKVEHFDMAACDNDDDEEDDEGGVVRK